MLVDRQGATIVHITDRSAPITTSQADETAPAIALIRVGEPSSNAAILSALFVPDQRSPTQGELRVRVGWFGRVEGKVRVRAEVPSSGETLADQQLSIEPGGVADATSSSLRADGREVRIVVVETGGIPADNRLTVRLPIRDDIVIAAAANLPTSLRLALESGPARLTGPDHPNAAIRAVRAAADTESRTRPEVVLITDGAAVPGGSPVLIVQDAALTDGLSLEDAVCGAGPGLVPPVDADRFTPLLTGGGAVLAALDEATPAHPRLLLSTALFTDEATVPNHPAFAMLISRSVRRLAGWGDPLAPIPVERVWSDPTWAHAIDTTVGSVRIPGSRTASDLSGGEHTAARATPMADGRWLTASRIMLLLALLLVVIDTLLHVRGRIV